MSHLATNIVLACKSRPRLPPLLPRHVRISAEPLHRLPGTLTLVDDINNPTRSVVDASRPSATSLQPGNMGRLVTLATCQLTQWALDFEGNRKRIVESIRIAKARGAAMRVGPELEITGYGCLDHFLESDVYLHSWEQIAIIMQDPTLHDIIIDIGLPVVHRNNRFNCRAIILNGKLIMLRPKLFLANDGIYREQRHFIPWLRPGHVEEYYLPQSIQKLNGCTKIPIGDCVLSTPDTCIGFETCEELFTPNSPHNAMGLNGVEIFSNSSGSHHSLRKLETRISLIKEATRKNGGIYLYSNQQGCDGDRMYYDGSSMIFCNGEILAQGSQFSLNDVEVITATIDLEEVRAYRFAPSRGLQSLSTLAYQRIETTFALGSPEDDFNPDICPTRPRDLITHTPAEEISLGPALWLWDYLRRSGASGFMLPLSGGIDSCATAVIVFSMARQIYQEVQKGNEAVIADVKRIAGPYHENSDWLPASPQELTRDLLTTAFMGMEKQSSNETRGRAKELSERIGSYHLDINIDAVFESIKATLTDATGFTPRFKVHGGSFAENIALQNIQSRPRQVITYYYAQTIPMVRQRKGGGGLLVLGSSNVDECLRGYLTKYDCSSADLNPIGSISKGDLKGFIAWAKTALSLDCLQGFIDATPTAELEPITSSYVQSDEADMGMTYAEIGVFGRLRKVQKLGPFGMWQRLCHDWREQYSPREVAEKVKRFHHFYAINRHKMTVATPAYHAEAYSPDDHRFDLRPFLYPAQMARDAQGEMQSMTWSFKRIDEEVDKLEKRGAETEKEKKKDGESEKVHGDGA